VSAPRALLLDFGSVISVSVFERHRDSERQLGLAPNSLTWLGPIDTSTDSLWDAMQRDEISEREYWAQRAREMGELVGEQGWDVNTMLRRIRQAEPEAVVRPEMRVLIAAARSRGIRLGVLSNELELFYGKDFLARMRVLEQFDTIVDASVTNVLKPDARSYAMAVEGLGVQAEEVLFVDDQFRNIAGAARAGLQTQFFDLRDVAGNIAAVAARLQLNLRFT
jgi:putative hydrolase of the HAD superfamily